MAPKKKVLALVKLQIRAGQATPAPPVGTALGQHGVNIMDFCKQYNDATQQMGGQVIPVELTIYEDRTFSFITEAAAGRRADQAGRRASRRARASRTATRSRRSARRRCARSPRQKMADLNANDVENGDADHRGHGAQHGRGGGRMTTTPRQALPRRRPRRSTANASTLPAEAIKILKELPDAKFDETVEVAFRLGVDTRKADQTLRGTVSLPNGTGKTVRVAVFAAGREGARGPRGRRRRGRRRGARRAR